MQQNIEHEIEREKERYIYIVIYIYLYTLNGLIFCGARFSLSKSFDEYNREGAFA